MHKLCIVNDYSFYAAIGAGLINVIYAGIVANVVRFIYIALLKSPWWILPFECIQGDSLTHSINQSINFLFISGNTARKTMIRKHGQTDRFVSAHRINRFYPNKARVLLVENCLTGGDTLRSFRNIFSSQKIQSPWTTVW